MSKDDKVLCDKFFQEFKEHIGRCNECQDGLIEQSAWIDQVPFFSRMVKRKLGGKSLHNYLKQIISEARNGKVGNDGQAQSPH